MLRLRRFLNVRFWHKADINDQAHFVIESPDLHLNVTGEHAGIFFHSALILAAVEFGGFVIGIYIFARES